MARGIYIASCSALAVLVGTSPCPGIVNGYEPDPDDHRFDAIAAFGLMQTTTGCSDPTVPPCDCLNTFGNGTLIAPNMMLMAKHTGLETMACGATGNPFPGGFAFRFRRGPDGKLATPEDCSTYYHVGVSYFVTSPHCRDIAIAILEEEITFIDPIPFDASIRLELDDAVIMGGWGDNGTVVHPGKLSLCNGTVAEITDCGMFSNAGDGCGVQIFDSGGGVVVETAQGLRAIGVVVGYGNACVDAHAMLDPAFELGPCCIAPPPSHPAGCADFNSDGIVGTDDLLIVIGAWGACSDCDACPIDLTHNCAVDVDELLLVIGQWGGPCVQPCPADIIYNNVVDVDDLNAVIAAWGPCVCSWCPADVDFDDDVDVDDLIAVISAWGPCPQ